MRLYKTLKRAVCAALFTKTISPDDVDQGSIGDCYYVSSLADLAAFEPEFIQKLITAKDGKFQVNFFDCFDEKKSAWKKAPWKQITVTFDDKLDKKRNGEYKYSYNNQDPTEMWFPLLEKAYAVWKGGYDKIGNGGYPDVALSELTGRKSTVVSTEAKFFKSQAIRENTILGVFEKADRNKYKVVCCTGGEGEVQDKQNPDVYTGHAYSYHGYDHDKHMIKLRNPWGEGSNPEGYFYITLPDFLKYYDTICYIP